MTSIDLWLDLLGLDSAFDHDPVRQRCIDLDVVSSFHASGGEEGSTFRREVEETLVNYRSLAS